MASVGEVILFNTLPHINQYSFLTIFNLGRPDILKINLVLNIKMLANKIGKDVMRWQIKKSGFSLFKILKRG